MGLLEGRVAFVTGAGQGLGEGISHALAREGAKVAVVGRTLSKVERVADELTALGYTATAVGCDITDRASVDAAVATTVERFGALDILVNNAMTQRLVPFEMATEEDLLDSYRSSVLGTFNCMKAAYPYLKEGRGKVINFGSGAGTEGIANMATYAASKEAVRGLSKAVATEWGKDGITVNVVVPTGTSPAWEKVKEQVGPEGVAKMMEPFLIPRMGDPVEDIGRIVVFLASAYSDYMTGRTLFADGGRSSYR